MLKFYFLLAIFGIQKLCIKTKGPLNTCMYQMPCQSFHFIASKLHVPLVLFKHPLQSVHSTQQPSKHFFPAKTKKQAGNTN